MILFITSVFLTFAGTILIMESPKQKHEYVGVIMIVAGVTLIKTSVYMYIFF